MNTNAQGNTVYRNYLADRRLCGGHRGSNRYFYDTGPCKDWRQYDTRQDASYFGVWVDLKNRRTFSYVEGDRTLVECPTIESFRAELEAMQQFYGDPPPFAVGMDTETGTVTHYFDERPKV